MSEVKRYKMLASGRYSIDPRGMWVLGSDYDAKCHAADVYFGSWKRTEEERDAALSQLAALREELADLAELKAYVTVPLRERCAERKGLQQRLADAEQRNAVRDAQLSKAIDFVERLCASAGNQPSIATGYLRDILDALNPNPEAASQIEPLELGFFEHQQSINWECCPVETRFIWTIPNDKRHLIPQHFKVLIADSQQWKGKQTEAASRDE